MNGYIKIFGLFDTQTKIRFEQVKFRVKYSGLVGSGSDEPGTGYYFFVPSEELTFFAKVVAEVIAKAHQEQEQFFSGKSFFIPNLIDLCTYLDFRVLKLGN